jgi:hypothetical protein
MGSTSNIGFRRSKTVFRKIVAVMLFIWMACCGLPGLSAQSQGPQDAEGSQFNTGEERIGELRLGLTEKDVHGNIHCKPRKDKEVFEAATGEYVQMWKFPECGIVLKMSSERKGAKKEVGSITITSPSKLVTGRGIHIGSTEGEVIEVYGRYRDQEGSGEKGKTFVAGSVYDGMIFDFQGGRVVRIFLGAAAE